MRPMSYNLLYDSNNIFTYLTSMYDLQYYMIYDENYKNSFFQNEEVKEMGTWPSKTSIKLIEDKIIIKLSEQP